ncbi:MAG: sensor histidine kinase KdpD [Clostridium sp.]
MRNEDIRPDPDELLEQVKYEKNDSRGRLKIFFGYAAGVGKTYSMLEDAHDQLNQGVDVIVGYIEPHTRAETMQLIHGLAVLPLKSISYKSIKLNEFNLELALERRPQLILVDELAHSNVEGSRNKKRYQDIEELINAGIDVYTTVNVQHIESLNDIIKSITKIVVRETVPDYIFDYADKVELIDIEPIELLKRFEEGKVYSPERAGIAMNNFFIRNNLDMLREISMRRTADRIIRDNGSNSSVHKRSASTKFMVLIGNTPSSSKNVRVTARMSEAFRAHWTAVYVETSKEVNSDNKMIRESMMLAEQLGGEVVTLYGDDIAIVASEYAYISGITNIVIGKSRKKRRLKELFKDSFEDRIISMLGDIEVHIIPGNKVGKKYKFNKNFDFVNKFEISKIDTIKMLVTLGSASLFSLLIANMQLGSQNIAMTYILSVVIVSRITSGYLYGIVSSIIGIVGFSYFFTYPSLSFIFSYIVMLFIALITSTLTVRAKVQGKLSALREQRTQILYEINKNLLSTRGLSNIIDFTNEYIVKSFNRSVIFYSEDPSKGTSGVIMTVKDDRNSAFLVSKDEKAVASWVFANKKVAGAGTNTLMGADAFYIPIISQRKVLGVLGVSCIDRTFLNQENRIFIRMITSQVAMALERQHFSDNQRKVSIEAEKEKMRNNLLRIISQDIQSPLMEILNKSANIIEKGDLLEKATHDKLLKDIKESSQWVIRMLENLLAVTDINNGVMKVIKIPESVEIIVNESIKKIKKIYSYSKININIANESLVVPMDAILIEQVIINVVENIIRNSDNSAIVDINVYLEKNNIVFDISDRHKDDIEEDMHIFHEYKVKNKSMNKSSSEIGIGISVCMSIIKAHGGDMTSINKKGRGMIFNFTLPL